MSPVIPRKFVFQGVGTYGDIAPLVSIGGELVRRGHECHLLANVEYGSAAIGAGMRFGPITDQTEIFWGAEQRGDPENYLFACARPVADYFREHLTGGPVVAVTADRNFALNLVSERFELPSARLYLTPTKVRSLVAPTWPDSAKAAGRLGHTFRKYALPRIQEQADTDPRVLKVVNRRRAGMGLEPVERIFHPEPYVRARIALFPDWFAAPAEDWPEMHALGFPFGSPREASPPALDAFIAREGTPLVFTPGTCVTQDLTRFFRAARECCERLGMPGIFLCKHLDQARLDAKRILCLDFVDLGLVLDRAALLVHHGGIGTVAQAVRAGIPQIIVPRGFDQPDNGYRVAKLGIGKVIDAGELTGATLASAATELLGSAPCKAAVARMKERTDTCAVARSADIVEAIDARAAEAIRPVKGNGRAPRTILLVVWPEPGHTGALIKVARELQKRGDRVVFACAEAYGPQLRVLGFEHFDLGGESDWGQRWSLFHPNIAGQVGLEECVNRLVETFRTAVDKYRPSFISFDSLYAAMAILADAAGIPWGLHETDLPREYDPIVPPSEACAVPDGSPRAVDVIRTAWRNQISRAFFVRRAASQSPSANLPHGWRQHHFPAALVDELHRRFGHGVKFDRFILYMPLARGPRMIFCPRELDFPRTRSAHGTWVGPCIDEQRAEPPFPWDELPANTPLAYCAFGTQSLRSPQAAVVIQTIVDVFAQRNDFFLVLACPTAHRPRIPVGTKQIIVVERAPQLALLRRASLALTHAGFNSVKECARYGVPMIALPLSHDQPRNAALIEYRKLGVLLEPPERATVAQLDAAVTRVRDSEEIRASCRNMARIFRENDGCHAALAFIDDVIASRRRMEAAPLLERERLGA